MISKHIHLDTHMGTSGVVMVSKLDYQTLRSDFKIHWVPYSFGFVPYLSKKLLELLVTSGGAMVKKLDYQTLTSDFKSHWVPRSFVSLPYISKSA